MKSQQPPSKTQEKEYIQYLKTIQSIVFNLNEENIEESTRLTMKLFDANFPFSFNFILSKLIYSSCFSQMKDINIYFHFMNSIGKKEEEIKSVHKLIDTFIKYILDYGSYVSDYILENMIEQKIVDSKITSNSKSLYFAHYKTKSELDDLKDEPFSEQFFENIDTLQKDNWKLHKKFVLEGRNPLEIANLIRNDDVEKLQEISSQVDFDFDQAVEPSLYERCSFINQEGGYISLIDYAAFFGSVKCFKFLLLNDSELINTAKYAVAGGNFEIIHLCEQNHALFEGTYKAAIKFHQNDIFRYLYENKIEEIKDLTKLAKKCILYDNYEILSYLEEEMTIDDNVINESAKSGNIFLVKHYIEGNQVPKDIFVYAAASRNIELVKYILEQNDIDINIKDIYVFYSVLVSIIFYFKKTFGVYSNCFIRHL